MFMSNLGRFSLWINDIANAGGVLHVNYAWE